MVVSDQPDDIHDLDVTVWVGKGGPDAVTEELDTQLDEHGTVKVRFLRAALGGTTAEELARSLQETVASELVDVRGHTAVFRR